MNPYRIIKTKSLLYDLLLGVLLTLFAMMIVLSQTLGSADFCCARIANDDSVTESLQQSIGEKTDAISAETGIVPEAFYFAVGQNKISALSTEIVKSVFAGNNYDYSDSADIRSAYHDGITEYYRFNGLDLDTDALDRAVPKACDAFNEVMGIGNSVEMTKMVAFLHRYSVFVAVGSIVLAVLVAIRLRALNAGRTKVFGDYGSALICAGDAMILMSVCSFVLRFGDKLYLTNNYAFNTAFAKGTRVYFIITLCIGVAFVAGGFSLLKYVRRHYSKKMQKNLQEMTINRSLYVENLGGEERTIGEIYDDRRKEDRYGTE